MGLGVIRALGRMGVPVIAIYYDPFDMGYVSKYVHESLRSPHPETCEESFLDVLQECAFRFPGSLLFPMSDESLKIVSKHKELLQTFYTVACTEWEITQRFIEKKYTYTLAASIGVPVPKTILPCSTEEVVHYGASIQYPCLVKPTESHRYYALFRKKMVRAENPDQLLTAYQEAAAAGLEVMLQEWIPGEDSLGVNYNSYYWDGQPLAEFTAQKVRNAPPELGSPCVVQSQEVPEVLESGRKIIEAMGFYGYSCTEFKLDPRDRVYKLMEVNGRHNLSTLLAVRCGINFPWIHYQHLAEGILPAQPAYRCGIYWIDAERDLAHLPHHLLQKKASLRWFLGPYLKPHVYGVFDGKDFKPFFKRYIDFAKKAGRRMIRPVQSILRPSQPEGSSNAKRRYST